MIALVIDISQDKRLENNPQIQVGMKPLSWRKHLNNQTINSDTVRDIVSKRTLTVGIRRRLSYLDELKNSEHIDETEFEQRALSYRFISSFKYQDSSSKNSSIDVVILKFCLALAHTHDVNYALKYLEHFDDTKAANTPLLKLIVNGETRISAPFRQKLTLSDQSIFDVENPGIDMNLVRSCYEKALSRQGIKLPFEKKGMEILLALVDGRGKPKKINGLDSLVDFIHSFLSTTWTLFSPKVLNVVFQYFKFHKIISSKEMQLHYLALKKFGFERLQTRLILLRAVNGDKEAQSFAREKLQWNDTGFEGEKITSISSFLIGEFSGVETIKGLTKDNPIEAAIFLTIYVSERKNEFDFVRRLESAYEFDTSIVKVLNWHRFLNDIDLVAVSNNPNKIFLAAILIDKNIRKNFHYIANQFGIGSAGADLRSYARYFRDEKKGTWQGFLKSFDVLGRNAKTAVVKFLILPGMLDRVTSFLWKTPSSAVFSGYEKNVIALQSKKECIEFGISRNIFALNHAEQMLSDIRTLIRHQKYRESDSEGRIKINETGLAHEVLRWLNPRRFQLVQKTGQFGNEYNRTQLAANADLIVPELAEFICYSSPSDRISNRYAFDIQLGDKLRHNFLAIQLKEQVEQIFAENLINRNTIDLFHTIVDSTISGFSNQWITIDRSRSFFANLNNELNHIVVNWGEAESTDFKLLSQDIAKKGLELFSRLLHECQREWQTTFLSIFQRKITAFARNNAEINQLISDRLFQEISYAVTESASWMQINEIGYPSKVNLRDLMFDEAFQLKKQAQFRRSFSCETLDLNGKDTLLDISIPGTWVEPVVAIVDNAISNACKNSGLGVNTPIELRLQEQNGGVKVTFSNRISRQNRTLVHQGVIEAKKILAGPIDKNVNQKKQGSGLNRIRSAWLMVLGCEIEIEISDKNISSDYVEISFFLPMKSVEWKRE